MFNLSTKYHILVGNGNRIPITAYGHTTLPNKPLVLRHVYLASQIIKNLIFVRKSTFDNFMSIEFDTYGFFVKYLRTGNIIMRSESYLDLYPVTPAQPSTCLATPLATISLITWHDHVGHPGAQSINFLGRLKIIL